MKKPDNWSKEQVGEDRAKQEGTEQGRTEAADRPERFSVYSRVFSEMCILCDVS